LAAVEKLYHQEPSIQEIARELATSHQNIKAIAVNLEKRGFIRLNKDPQDKRVTRLSVTTKSKEFWQKREKEDIENFLILFKHLTNEERVSLHKSLMKLLKEADSFTKRISKPKEEE
jgi:DNA-binding MarR family transcriptional regulator